MVLAVLQRGLLVAVAERTAAVTDLLRFDVWIWVLWLALSPAIVTVARRFPFRVAVLRDGFAHLIAALALSTVHTAALGTLPRVMQGGMRPELRNVFELLSWRLAFDAFIYGTVVAVTLALDAAARARAEEMAASRAAAESSRAQLHALQMQIQPHFVFNTLNTAAMMARDGNAAGAADVITRLADMLRDVVTETPGTRVTLRDELEFVQRYLAIEQARFGSRLRVDFTVAPEALDVQVPRFILQPIVENAVRHGLSRSPTSGSIGIATAIADGRLAIRVTDDGAGLQSEDGGPGGIGLRNTRSRLAALYGADFELALTGDSRGATVTMRLPLPTPSSSTAG